MFPQHALSTSVRILALDQYALVWSFSVCSSGHAARQSHFIAQLRLWWKCNLSFHFMQAPSWAESPTPSLHHTAHVHTTTNSGAIKFTHCPSHSTYCISS